MTINRYYIMILTMNIILDQPFISYQFDLMGIVKFEDTFSGSRSNKFLNSLYITLGTLEI